MPVHRIAIKRPNEPLQQLSFEGTYRVDVATLVGSDGNKPHLQFIPLQQKGTRCLAFACDEDGLYKKLPHNFYMLSCSGSHTFFEAIVGNIVFLVYRQEDTWDHDIWDYQLEDLNDADMLYIEKLLSKETQTYYKTIAKKDPGITKTPTVYFEPIDNIEEFFGLSPSLLRPMPSFMIPFCLLEKRQLRKPIEFFADKQGKEKYTTGIRLQPTNTGEIHTEIYCKSKNVAQELSIISKQPITVLGSTDLWDLFARYMEVLHSWGVPSVVYVTEKTEAMLQAN